MKHEEYDVLIIGSGIGGLTCGARLAALGHKVAVFEQHYVAGGYATNFKRKGYTFDVSLHGVAGLGEGQSLYKTLDACNAIPHIVPLKKQHPYSLHIDGEIIRIPSDRDEYRRMLQDRFPAEKEGIAKLFDAIKQLGDELAFLSDPSVAGWKKILLFPFKCKTLMKWGNMTTEQVMQQYVHENDLINIFTALWSYYGLPPKKLAAYIFFIPWLGYHVEGTYYIKGGGQSLSDALVKVIEEAGGKVFLTNEVQEILIENKTAVGLRTKKHADVRGKWVVSNTSPMLTLGQMVKNHPHAEAYRARIAKQEIGCSLLQLYLGLNCSPQELGIVDEDLIVLDEKDNDTDYQHSLDGKYEFANYAITSYSNMDSEFTDDSKGIIAIGLVDDIRNWPQDKDAYRQKKEEVTDILLARLEARYPGIRERIVMAELGTPRTMERYTRNPQGAVYGFAQILPQSGMKRLKNSTPFKRLSLVGAWTQPGGGYAGAAQSGFQEAERIHKMLQKIN